MNPDSENSFRPGPAVSSRAGGRFMARVWDSFCQMLEAPASRLHLVAGSLLLLALVLAVYQPVLPGKFLMDDWRLISTDNALVNGEVTPLNIWFQSDFTLSYVALWLQWLAWGTSPGGYHVVNLLLHATSAVLVWRLLGKLKIPGAWLAAALYAVHPVCVNSVARIAEIKNTLSLPFFLFSFWAWLQYENSRLYPEPENPPAGARPRRFPAFWYACALLAFIAALLAKTSTVMLPVVFIACALWRRGHLRRQDWVHTAPFFLLSLAFGLMSIWFQKHQALFSAGQTLAPETFGQRLAIAGHVFSFYLGKALFPFHLNLVYPRWKLDAADFSAWFPYLAFAFGSLWCWRFRPVSGGHILFALGCFAITLFPVMGFFDSQFLVSWQVSDHLEYLPLIAPVALVAGGLGALLDKSAFRLASVVLVAALSVLAYQRASVFSTEEKLLRDSIAKNPAASASQNDLGVIFAQRRDYTAAMNCFAAAVQADPGNADARSNYGQILMFAGRFPEAEAQYQAALKLMPYDVNVHERFAQLLQREGRNREAIYHDLVALRFKPDVQTRTGLASLFYQTGSPHQAVEQYRQILRTAPGQLEALNNLAWLLATSGDATVRNGTEAVRYAEQVCQLTGYRQPRFIGTLAAAYAEAGRFPEAVATGQTAVKLANDAGDQNASNISSQLLNLYLNNQPYHEPIAAKTAGW